MQHRIPTATLGPMGASMARAVEGCVHCGFCLPVCPTYQTLGEEMDSPRGRIFLMKEVLEGGLPAAEAAPYVDRCLGCLACVTACPSGVDYGALLTPYRARTEAALPRSLADRARRRVLLETLMRPALLKWALAASTAGRALRAWLPPRLAAMADLSQTAQSSASAPLAAVIEAQGARRARVALLQGCAQQVLAPRITEAAARVLSANGVEVHLLPAETCCGALGSHAGRMDLGRPRAEALIDRARALLGTVDAILTTTAGCGSAMHEYPLWFAGASVEDHARKVATRTEDVTVFLARLGLVTPLALSSPRRVAYHDACHLAHAQGVRQPPRTLLESIDGVSLVTLADSDTCCGSAGIYNVEQPEVAETLGDRKAAAVAAANAEILATGNVGCMAQISRHLPRVKAAPVEVVHTVELLAQALPAK